MSDRPFRPPLMKVGVSLPKYDEYYKQSGDYFTINGNPMNLAPLYANTKEIGVLRAPGARKKDITRLFNAETFIIGLCSGCIGVGVGYLLTFPINLIVEQLSGMGHIAQMNPIHAIILIAGNVVLILLGGWIPSRMAAKKKPVTALRSE